MVVQIQVRRDTAANWTSNDPTLAEGEMGLETDTGLFKFGDGATAWTSLAYFASGFTNPMTTQDDVIVGGASGVPGRLGKGSDGQVLTVDPSTHHLVWATPSAGSGDVATDTIWDAKGDLAIGTGSDTASRLAVGTDGDVLTADSGEATGVKWATPTGGSGALVPLEQHTASGSSVLDFTTFLSGTYDHYQIDLSELLPASSGAQLLLRAITSGGVDSTSDHYHLGGYAFVYNGNALFGGGGGLTAWGFSNASDYGTVAGDGASGVIDLWTAGLGRINFHIGYGTSGAAKAVVGTGRYDGGGTITGVRFLFSTGNIASGTVRIYGIAKS